MRVESTLPPGKMAASVSARKTRSGKGAQNEVPTEESELLKVFYLLAFPLLELPGKREKKRKRRAEDEDQDARESKKYI